MTARALWIASIAVLIVLVAFMPIEARGQWFFVLQDSGHGAAFAVIAWLCMATLRSRPIGVAAQYATAFAVMAFLGVATEALQVPLPRDADWVDLGNDVLGTWLGLAVYAAFDARLARNARWLQGSSAIVPALLLAAPLALSLGAYARRAAAFPVIADYNREADLYFVRPQWAHVADVLLPQAWAREPGERALQVRFDEGRWPGLHYFEPAPDWDPFAMLALDVTNTGDSTITLAVRVHDAQHNGSRSDRFNATVKLPARERTVVRWPLEEIRAAPRDRALDLRRVAGMHLFPAGESRKAFEGELLISRIWLE